MPLRQHTMPDFARVVNHDPSMLTEHATVDTLTGLSTISVKAPEVHLMHALSEYMRIVVDCYPVDRDEMYRIILKNPKSNTPDSYSNIYEFQPGKVMELRYHPTTLIHEVETNLTFLEKTAKYFGYARKQTVHDYQSWVIVAPLDSNEDPKINVSRKAEFIFRPDSDRMSSKELKPVITLMSTISKIAVFISAPGFVKLLKDYQCLSERQHSWPVFNDVVRAAHPDLINIIEIVLMLVESIEELEMRVDKLRAWHKLLKGSIIDSEFLQFVRNCFAAVKRQLEHKDNTSLEAASPSTALCA
ncbi:hypothetical protein BGW41_006806 [Actinomortierella wolfii]|nr:hypothetical protein BGW41_006806 [Actinomortierella wolfii]